VAQLSTDSSGVERELSIEQIDQALDQIASGYGSSVRSPLFHTPAEHGLEYEDVTFASEDGVPLEAWFIPAAGSSKIVIANHPRWFSRSGLPGHLEPWKSLFGAYGNDFEVNFVLDYARLHDEGYNVLAYDLRNFGHSGAANGGLSTGGIYESRDVIGSLRYVRRRRDTEDMTIGLFSRCLGCNATFFAASRRPEEFEDVRCLVGPQPLSPRLPMERRLELLGIPLDRMPDLDRRIRLTTSFGLDDMSPVTPARRMRVPTLLYQVRDDAMTHPSDVQEIFDSIPTMDKKLIWIDGTSRRWDGYTYFARRPDEMLDWLARYMR
jgi:uncharacterized protein